MLDRPPPSTIASGSSRLTTCASARASRSAWRSSAAAARASPAAARGRQRRRHRARPARRHRRRARGRRGRSRGSPAGRTSSAGRDAPPPSIQGSGLWPHSPATRLRPSNSARRATTPPPTPVPRMTAKTIAEPRAGAVGRLAHREAVGVVGEPHRAGQPRLQVRVQRPAVQPGGIGTAHQAGRGRGLPGMPMPTVAAPPSSRSAVFHQPGDRAERAGVVAGLGARRRSSAVPSGPRATISILVPPRSTPMRRTCPRRCLAHGRPQACRRGRRRCWIRAMSEHAARRPGADLPAAGPQGEQGAARPAGRGAADRAGDRPRKRDGFQGLVPGDRPRARGLHDGGQAASTASSCAARGRAMSDARTSAPAHPPRLPAARHGPVPPGMPGPAARRAARAGGGGIRRPDPRRGAAGNDRAAHPRPPAAYVDAILAIRPEPGERVALDGDTLMNWGSAEAALRAAGAAVAAVDAVCGGEVRRAFCAVRPPGHHAEPATAHGLLPVRQCRVAARHAQAVARPGTRRHGRFRRPSRQRHPGLLRDRTRRCSTPPPTNAPAIPAPARRRSAASATSSTRRCRPAPMARAFRARLGDHAAAGAGRLRAGAAGDLRRLRCACARPAGAASRAGSRISPG